MEVLSYLFSGLSCRPLDFGLPTGPEENPPETDHRESPSRDIYKQLHARYPGQEKEHDTQALDVNERPFPHIQV